MAEQRRRMTYEEQRALREREQVRAERQQARVERTERQQARAEELQRTHAERVSRVRQSEHTASHFTVDKYSSDRASGSTQRVERNARATRTTRTSARTSANATRTTRTTRTTRDEFSRRNYGGAAVARPPIFKIGIAIVLLVAVVLVVRLCSAALPINVTVNGTAYELRGAKTVETAIKTSGLPINPGDLISLNGNVLEKSAGEPFLADVNGTETADPGFALHDGDVVNVTDGNDIVEEYDAVQSSIPYGATIAGVGAVHKFVAGEEGTMETRTGRISGETVEKRLVEPTNVTCQEYNLNTGANKVVAFTFDDGPSEEYTAEVLKILKENDAKGTFFVIGQCVEEYPDLVAQEAAEGHQVCTHSYDHAEPVGGTNVGFMDAAGQIDEVVHGKKTITDVLGGEASGVVRMPGGNLTEDMVLNLQPYVDYEIGWNIDTQDWTLPGAEAIYQEMISAQPGDIILCHDGGGDRSETVEALRRALPYLKSKGFTFLTMDEILEYPASA
ncbi:MAG: polysaccharide deacetylase family protein [Eggerthellaceae bacterium]|nr:polysaccharide deacetylase family protein [Eggerthellaceae bacterium]